MRKRTLRYCGSSPGGVESEAETPAQVVAELLAARTSERQGRVIDHDPADSMEKKKQEGYF